MKALSSSGIIRYPITECPDTKVHIRVPPGVVVDGQLMGHPLSFPLLCVINLSVLRCAVVRYISSSDSILQRYDRERIGKLILDNVIVNGDDMLFKCPSDFYDIFKATAADAGFQLSVGKNYLSEVMCMINSQIFKLDRSTNQMVRQGYLNQKFLVPTNDAVSNPTQLSKDLNKMIHLCPWTECIIPSIFLRRWMDNPLFDRGYEVRPNWFLPIHLGGYGVDRKYAPKDNKITVTQRKLARYFMKDIDLQLFVREPELNRDIIQLTNKLVRDGLMKYQVTDLYRPMNIFETEESDPWLGRLSLMLDMANSEEIPTERYFIPSHINLRGIRPFSHDKIDRLHEIKLFSHVKTAPPPLFPITTLRPIKNFWNLMKELPFSKFPKLAFRGFGFV
jgi:hypothetical protein